MPNLVFYFHLHQPYRVKQYNIFSVGKDHDYWREDAWQAGTNNERIFKKVATKSYRPMLKILEKSLSLYPDFCFSISLTGTFLEQALAFAPDLIDTLKRLSKTGRMEIVAETYYHSLAFFFDQKEFEQEVELHLKMVQKYFQQRPRVFRNTELAYDDSLALWAEQHHFKAVLAEGWDKILAWRSPNLVYRAAGTKNLRLLLKNYRLSDDIAFRFSDKNWSEWPLSVEKYQHWLEQSSLKGPLLNLFIDFETFGENIWEDTGIFNFFEHLLYAWQQKPNHQFLTVSQAAALMTPVAELSMPYTVTWADSERDLSAWLGNDMQKEAMRLIYELKKPVLATKDPVILCDWRRLLTSDHPYYMTTKYFNDGDVHAYFSPYESPYDAFLYYMNALRDLRWRLERAKTSRKH